MTFPSHGAVKSGSAVGAAKAERSAAHRARLRELVRVEQNVIVRAGAGTGKTFSLVACVLHQLAGVNRAQVPVAPARVCAITFTEKAAAEMLERVQEAVEALIEAPDSHPQARLLHENAAELRVEPPGVEHWRCVRRDLGAMVISTFHGFCAQILREYPVEAGVEPGFALTDELQTGALLSELIENIVYERLAEGDPACLRALRALPVRQGAYGQALSEVLGRVLRRLREDGLQVSSLRGRHRRSDEAQHRQEHARSLKMLAQQKTLLTRLWASLDPSMLADGSVADRVLLADLKAFAQEADDLQKMVESLKPEQLSDHLGPLARYVKPLRRRARQARILSGRQAYRVKALPTFQERYLERMLRHAGEQLRQDVLGLLEEVEERYGALKRSMGALDFTDLVVLARDALRDEATVRRALKRRFEIVLVDEFQDTNDVQLDLVMMLGEVLAEEAALTPTQKTLEAIKLHPGRLFLVGDPKQSIYNFRGADVGVFNRVERHLVGRAQVARRYALQQNRRSLPALLEFGNRWFADVLGEPQVNDPDFIVRFTDQDRLEAAREVASSSAASSSERARAERSSSPGSSGEAVLDVDVEGGGAQRAEHSGEAFGPAPVVEYLAFPPGHAAVDEARAVARWIERYVRGDGGHQVYHAETNEPEACRYGHVAVLLRHFRHLAAYQDALQRLQIPYFVVKGRGFYGCAEVRDLHMLLRLLLDPDDGLALVGVLRSPLALVSDAGLLWLQRGARGRRRRALTLRAIESLLDSPPAEMAADDLEALRRFMTLRGALSDAAGRLGPRGVLAAAIRLTRLREQLAGTFRGRQKIGNLEKLLDLAEVYERSQVGHLAGFSRRLAQLIAEEPREPEGQVVEESADVVRIMTIHQSKGLEFPVVVLPEVHAMVGRPAAGAPIQYDRAHGLQVRMRVRHMGQVVADLETEGYEALRRAASAREEAEERRLVYVAATRARDLLWISGRGIALREDGSRVEARHDNPLVRLQALASLGEPAIVGGSRERARGELLARTEADERAQEREVEAAAEAQRGWRAALSGLTPPVPRRPCPTYAVTQLADFYRCPRRYYYAHVMGLADRASPDDAREWTLTSHAIRDRGTAAHAVLEHLDYEAYAVAESDAERLELLRATLRPMSLQLPRAAREEVYETLRAALCHPQWARRLAQAQAEGRLERERPAVIHLRGERSEVTVRGRLDMLLTLDQGPTLILDHKYCARSAAGLAPHRFQLAVYALMAQPRAESWVAGVFFMKDAGGEPVLLRGDGEELEQLRVELPELAARLTAAHLHDRWPRGDDRAARVCRAEGCAFAARCWGGPQEGAAPR